MLINVLKLISGNAAAQLITVLTMPLVTRLYSPAEFGVFTMLLAAISILAPLSTLRFNEAIILAKDNTEACNLFALSISASLFVCLFLSLLDLHLSLNQSAITSLFRLGPDLAAAAGYLWIVPVGTGLRGLMLSTTSLSLQQKLFSTMAKTSVLTTGCSRFTVIAAGVLVQPGVWGLIGGRLLGNAVALCYIWSQTLKSSGIHLSRHLTLAAMGRMARRYKHFPLYGSWSILFHTGGRDLVIMILAVLFPSTMVGCYALAFRMINLPLAIIGFSLNRVFLQQASSIKEDERLLQKTTVKMVKMQIYSALPPVIVLIFLGDHLFELIFGSQWLEAGVYAQLLAPSLFFMFLYIPLRSLFITREKTRERLLFDVLYFIPRMGIIIAVALLSTSPRLTIFSLSLTTCLLLLIFLIYASRLISLPGLGLFRQVFWNALPIIPLAVALAGIRWLLPWPGWLELTAGGLLLVGQWILILKWDNEAAELAQKVRRQRWS